MRKIFQFNRRRQIANFIPILLAAIIIGAVFGFYLPDYLYQTADDGAKANSIPIKGDIKGHAIITDGDTIKINGIKIRFHGIDAPEINQPCWIGGRKYQCGVEAKAYLNRIINNQVVMCVTLSTDRYDRKIAKCYNYMNEDIEALMVTAGMAVAYTYYSYDYILEEASARVNDRGIWAGDFQNPYNFRQRN